MFCAWLIRRWNFAYLHHIHTRESPSEYSERRYWSTLMYVVLKFLSCLQFQYQTAGIRKLLVRWCGLIFLHSYLGGVLKFFDIWLGLAASSNVKEFQYSSSVTVQEYPRHQLQTTSDNSSVVLLFPPGMSLLQFGNKVYPRKFLFQGFWRFRWVLLYGESPAFLLHFR